MHDNIVPLFSTPIYHVEDVDYRVNDQEKECITHCISSLFENSNVGLSNNVYVLESLALRNIRQLCQHHLDVYTKQVLRIKQDFYITNSWITIKNKGQYHHKHAHQNCIFSGVFYVNADSDMGGLSFHGKQGYLNNFNFDYHYDNIFNVYNSSEWQIPVKTGTMIIFPSHVDHSVNENCKDDTRIVIGFNSFVKGDFGNEEHDTYCSRLHL